MTLILFLMTFACSDYTVAGIKKREADILVHPTHLNFGHLISGMESESESFAVINTGDEDLTIFAPELVSGNDRFSLTTDQESYIIPAGGLIEFDVEYTPETFESNGAYIDIVSDDIDEPVSTVTIEGYGDAPVIAVDPVDVDYGDISIGCDNEERITIRNEGNMDLEVSSISQMVTQPSDILFELGSLPDPPWILAPGMEIDFLVSYIPTDIGADDSSITILSNDPQTPEVEALQHGDGDVEQWVQQQWEQDEVPILDILWVIDDSGSMYPFQQSMSSNIGFFMGAFASSGADYRMAVITTGSSAFNTIIDSTHPDAENAIASLIMAGIGGPGIERGIQMAHDALTSGNAAPGGAFFRQDAKLVIIFLSDEPDQSYGGWYSFVSFFDNLKPLGDFVPYAVIGDEPSGCLFNNGVYTRNAQFGAGYWDLVDYYGGSWYSICAQDWGVQLQALANEVTEKKVFDLDEPDPIETTIEVYVNGQLTTEWTYDAALNAVVFNDGHVPHEGQTITIDYALWGCGTES
jgi:hypothetical protein